MVDELKRHSLFGGEQKKYTTFVVAGKLYGIDVILVQEVVRKMPSTKIPMAPQHLTGLINLRGQIATGIGIRELFELPVRPLDEQMNVVCRSDGVLVSFQVDDIGDVLELDLRRMEPVPPTVGESVRRFLSGIYKLDGQLLSIIDIEQVATFLGLKAIQSVI